jgi:hypothetical protein
MSLVLQAGGSRFPEMNANGVPRHILVRSQPGRCQPVRLARSK